VGLKNKILNKLRYQTLQVYPGIFRPQSKPFISGDTFRKHADHIFDETGTLNPKNVKKNDIVFLKTDFLELYFNHYHPKITKKYILITHNSDIEIGINEEKYFDDKLVHWFASNLVIDSSKSISPIPLGLENRRYLSNGRLKNFKKISKTAKVKEDKVLCSFSTHTNPLVRSELIKNVENIYYVDLVKSQSQFEYLTNLNKYKFNLCPEGNAPETHRLWESLVLNVVPICVENSNNLNFFNLGVPMVLIKDWSSIKNYDLDYLLSQYDNISKDNMQKYSSFNFWWETINAKK